jgi:hypothetical protein
MNMTKIARMLLLPAVFLASTVGAYATTIDFVGMANGAGGYGESEYSNVSPLLTFVDPTFTLTVKAFNGTAPAGAYLDSGHGGLGVCSTGLVAGKTLGKQGSSGDNVCGDGSDDNVTTGEKLVLSFDKNVRISTIVFNDNHDDPFTMLGGHVVLNGVVSSAFAAGDDVGGGDFSRVVNFNLAANTDYSISYSDRQFYVSSITVSAVPEPASLALMCIGVMGLALASKRLKPALRSNR